MKTIIAAAALLVIMVSSATVSLAASGRCVVVKVEDKELVLECERGTEDFQPGQEVKIKVERARAAIEGC